MGVHLLSVKLFYFFVQHGHYKFFLFRNVWDRTISKFWLTLSTKKIAELFMQLLLILLYRLHNLVFGKLGSFLVFYSWLIFCRLLWCWHRNHRLNLNFIVIISKSTVFGLFLSLCVLQYWFLLFLYRYCIFFCDLLKGYKDTRTLFIILTKNSIIVVVFRIVKKSNPLRQFLSQNSEISIFVKANCAIQLVFVEN